MENFEISDSFVGITQIWEVFFLPIVSVAIVFLFIYFLMGKQYISNIYKKYKIIKIDNKYYRQKRIKIKREHLNGNKGERVILLPLSEMSEKMVTAVQNPIVFIIIFLLLVYAIYKLINLCSLLYPMRYSFIGSSMLLYSTPKEIIAEIWTYFPEYALESLYQKISILGDESSYAKYVDYSAIHMFGSIFKFCSVLCIINFFINKPKIKIYLKTVFLFLVCFFAIVLSFYFQFQKDTKVLEQKAYYVEFKNYLSKNFNHSFENLHSIVCWDINTADLKNGQEVTDIANKKRTLKIIAPEQDGDYTRYYLDSMRSERKIEIFVLKYYLEEKFGITFVPRNDSSVI